MDHLNVNHIEYKNCREPEGYADYVSTRLFYRKYVYIGPGNE